MILGNLSRVERLGHNALFYSLSKGTTQKWLIYHQKREKSEKCPIILLERDEGERERAATKSRIKLQVGYPHYWSLYIHIRETTVFVNCS